MTKRTKPRLPGESEADFRRRDARERMRRWRGNPKNLEKQAAAARAKYATDPAVREGAQRRKAANPETYRAYSRNHFERNREAKIAKLKEWVAANPDRHRAAKMAWDAANKPLLASYSAKWRRCCRIATPAWADFEQIKAFYVEAARLTAETGIPHEVDHIIPVQGKTVCGLHVQTNLRVITAAANARKHNRLEESLIRSADCTEAGDAR